MDIELVLSLGLVHEVGDLIDIEVQKSALLMDGVASEVLSEKYMPVWFEFLIHVLLQVFSHLQYPKIRTF